MRVGIVAPFNPASLEKYLAEDSKRVVTNINYSASSVNNIVKSLIDLGHEVWVFTLGKKTIKLEGDNLHIVIIEGPRWNYVFPNIKRLSKKIERVISDYIDTLDVIHCHWCYEYALASMRFAQRIPVFCTIRDWAPVIYSQISIRARFTNILFKAYWRYKIVIFEEVISNPFIHFVANSEYTASLYNTVFPERAISLIHNSIEDELILETPKVHDKTFISISMSLDDVRKNIISLVKAFGELCKDYDDYKLVLIGNYHKNGNVYQYVMKNGLEDKVLFVGIKNRSEIISLLDSSFCMVHPAYEETFGNIIIEAMARGVIVIGGADSGAVPYVLQHGRAGVLCNVKDYQDIKEKMEIVIRDDSFGKRVVDNATKQVAHYANSKIGEKHIELYRKQISV